MNLYKVILGLKQKDASSPDKFNSVTFEFGDKNLWIDKISEISQAEVWLEVETDNAIEAKKYLKDQGCSIRHEIEPFPPRIECLRISQLASLSKVRKGYKGDSGIALTL